MYILGPPTHFCDGNDCAYVFMQQEYLSSTIDFANEAQFDHQKNPANIEIVFRNIYGREKKVAIVVPPAEIGSGGFGNIYQTEVKLTSNKSSKEKTAVWVLKEFYSEDCCKSSFEKFSLLKEKGLKVFATYRISDDDRYILMTNGNRENFLLVSHNDSLAGNYLENSKRIKFIREFNNFLEQFFQETEKATENWLAVSFDAYFFSISPAKEHGAVSWNNTFVPLHERNFSQYRRVNLDFILGDLDHINMYKPSYRKEQYLFYTDDKIRKKALKNLTIKNLLDAVTALVDFLEYYVGKQYYQYYLQRIEKFVQLTYQHKIGKENWQQLADLFERSRYRSADTVSFFKHI